MSTYGFSMQDPAKPYTVVDLFARMGIPVASPSKPSVPSQTGRRRRPTPALSESSRTLINVVCKDGERTDHLTRLSGALLYDGFSPEEALRQCQEWNSRNTPPLDDEKVVDTVGSIRDRHLRNHPEAALDTEALTPLFALADASVAHMINTAAPVRKWLLTDCLPLGLTGMVVASGGTGKSQWMLQLGMSVASGVKLAEAWEIGSVGGALLIFAEDEVTEIHRRFERTLNEITQIDPNAAAAIGQRLFIKSMVGERNLMTEGQRSGSVVATDYADRLILVAKQIPDLKLVVIDPASRFRGGDENSAEDSTRFVQELDYIALATGATVLVAHHVNKGSAQSDEPSQNAVRGSSALTDGVRWQMNLTKPTDKRLNKLLLRAVTDDDRRRIVVADVTKNNYAGPQPERVLTRKDGGYLTEIRASSTPMTLDGKILAHIRNEAAKGNFYSANQYEKMFGGTANILGVGINSVGRAIRLLIARRELRKNPKDHALIVTALGSGTPLPSTVV